MPLFVLLGLLLSKGIQKYQEAKNSDRVIRPEYLIEFEISSVRAAASSFLSEQPISLEM